MTGRTIRHGLILFFLTLFAIALIATVFVATWFSIYVIAQPLYWAVQRQAGDGAFYFLGLLMMVLLPLALFGLALLLLRGFTFVARRTRGTREPVRRF